MGRGPSMLTSFKMTSCYQDCCSQGPWPQVRPLSTLTSAGDSQTLIGKSSLNKLIYSLSTQFSCSVLADFATPWTALYQASLSITKSQSLIKLMSIESVMPSNHLIFCRPLLLPPSILPSIRIFSNESVLRIMCIDHTHDEHTQTSHQGIEMSASVSVLPKNIQDGFPLRLIGLISLQSKEDYLLKFNIIPLFYLKLFYIYFLKSFTKPDI